MKKKAFFTLFLFLLACGPQKQDQVRFPLKKQSDDHVKNSDKIPNGGFLRFTLKDKTMHDNFFVAQFTPKGNIFTHDNLQLFNYNLGSDKYPQFIINIDFDDSDLKKWQERVFPLDFLAFTASPSTTPLNSRGQVHILKVSDDSIEGSFSGELYNPVTKKTFPIRGEFKGIVMLNV